MLNYLPLSLNALAITDTELKLMAVAAIMKLSKSPKNGNNTAFAGKLSGGLTTILD